MCIKSILFHDTSLTRNASPPPTLLSPIYYDVNVMHGILRKVSLYNFGNKFVFIVIVIATFTIALTLPMIEE